MLKQNLNNQSLTQSNYHISLNPLIPRLVLLALLLLTTLSIPITSLANSLTELQAKAANGDAKAQFNLALMYDNGEGVPKDDAQAVHWYRKAAEQGYAKAQHNLALMYYNGEGVPKDDAQAVHWDRKAAEQGLAQAQFNLGVMYDNGKGVPKDDAQAVHWYRKAAEQGYAKAQHNLGVMYYNGEGISKDDVTAYIWFNLAAAQGYKDAAEARDKLSKDMTNDQIAEAQARSSKCLANNYKGC